MPVTASSARASVRFQRVIGYPAEARRRMPGLDERPAPSQWILPGFFDMSVPQVRGFGVEDLDGAVPHTGPLLELEEVGNELLREVLAALFGQHGREVVDRDDVERRHLRRAHRGTREVSGLRVERD